MGSFALAISHCLTKSSSKQNLIRACKSLLITLLQLAFRLSGVCFHFVDHVVLVVGVFCGGRGGGVLHISIQLHEYLLAKI